MFSASVSGMSVRLSGLSGISGLSGLSGLFLYIICVSASPHEIFRYHLLSTRRAESCSMCFGDDCWELEVDRCRYYAEAGEMLPGGGGGESGEGGEVDTLVYDMVGQAASSWMLQDCVPFISYHTDCNKENICMGCRTCSCDAAGRWNCSRVQQCRPEPTLNVDHRILKTVLDTLKEGKITRSKRNAKDIISYDEPLNKDIDEWIHDVRPDVDYTDEPDINYITTTKTITTDKGTTQRNKIESDSIDFDEVLKNIADDNQEDKRQKSQVGDDYEIKEHIDITESVIIKNNETDLFVNMLNDIERNQNNPLENTTEESTTVLNDLLSTTEQEKIANVTNDVDRKNNIIPEDNVDIDFNDTIIYDAVNIMKRDVNSVTNMTKDMSTEKTNNPIDELKDSVLVPLTKIVDDKEQELQDLIKIKNNLIQFIKDYNSTDLEVDMKNQEIINNTNTVLSIYNLDIFPDIQFNLRKINPDSQEKLLYKLKRDIYEVIRDVTGIKKLYGVNKLPDDLKLLIRSMIVYVHKQGNVTNFIKTGIKLKDQSDQRRQLGNEDSLNSTKDYLIKILETLFQNQHPNEAFSSISYDTRNIVARVIKNLYSDDYSIIAPMMFDPEFSFTNDLDNIGSKWDRMTNAIAESAPVDKIYAMKLLHLVISVDINKLNDVLALVDFANSRRMTPVDERREIRVLEKINIGLRAIDKKIKILMRIKSGEKIQSKSNPITKPNKRKSFFNKIRNLLKGSRSDVMELVNKNVPRSEIVKTIAKRRLDELAQKQISDYQNTMRKWQNTLNVIPRYKRDIDLVNRHKNRMKNIIPKYLRGKLDPFIVAKKMQPRQALRNEPTPQKETKRKNKKVMTATEKIKTKVTTHDLAQDKKSGQLKKQQHLTRRHRSQIGTTKASR